MLGVKFFPTILKSSFQNALKHLLSLSLTMLLGSPCNLKTYLNNSSSTCLAGKVVVKKKWENLLSLSTTTNIQSLQSTLGKPVMKSMEMISHFCSWRGNGCKSPVQWVCSTLFCCNVGNSLTYFITSSFNPFHENIFLNIMYVLKKLGWHARGESWDFFNISSFKLKLGTKYILYL